VCSPSLLEGDSALRAPEDINRFRLLHTRPRLGEWRGWLVAAGVDHPNPEAGPKFDDYALTLEAAASGLGIAIPNKPAAESYIRSGRLAMPFEVAHITEAAYYLVYPEINADDERVRTFRDWLLEILGSDE
jgi:LysR family transcriptional regulator, glycine cleavage system transcriptional activator